ncbi:MAG: GNAT family N-acetyltransferase [Deltaproteobacteria bacterium]|nr:GNAT family N-acetyltransferase [Deltaproteobacteria bacterium]MBW2446185.1 GNAT family N-acetyltransferase [Deltaproteobacteria bacterium]
MKIRAFHRDDAGPLSELSAGCLKGETDFVLNPLWETSDELFAEYERFGITPEESLLVAEDDAGAPAGIAGVLRRAGARNAGLVAPVVGRELRGQGVGGDLLRATLELGKRLDVHTITGALGTRNRGGYSLLTSLGFQPLRQHFMMRCEERPVTVDLPVSGLTLEAAKPEDADAILEIYGASGFDEARGPDRIREVLSDGIHFHAVARREGRVVAFVELETHWPTRVWVAYVGVDASLRNQGVGSTTVSWALQRVFDSGATSALLLLSPVNRPAVRAYQKVGFHLHRTIDVLHRQL